MLKVPKAVIDQIDRDKFEVADKCYSKCDYIVIMGYIMIHTFSRIKKWSIVIIQQPLFNNPF